MRTLKIPDRRESPGLVGEFTVIPECEGAGVCGDGLEIIRKLLRQARTRLTDEGIVLIEVGGLVAAMDEEFAALEPHWLHTADGADCVCVIHAARLAAWRV